MRVFPLPFKWAEEGEGIPFSAKIFPDKPPQTRGILRGLAMKIPEYTIEKKDFSFPFSLHSLQSGNNH